MKHIFTSAIAAFVLFGCSMRGLAQSYCAPTATAYGCSDLNIQSFSTTGGTTNISNNNSGCGSSDYSDFTATMTHTTMQGTTVNYSFTLGGWDDAGVKIWVDFNADGDFDDPGEKVYETGPTGTTFPMVPWTSTVTGSFTVPYSATPGTTRLRIRGVSYSNDYDPCSTPSWEAGETEDYAFDIVAAPVCTGQPDAGTLPASLGVCSGIPFTITAAGATGAGSMTFQWQSRFPAGTGTWTNIAGANGFSYTSPGITAATDYRFYEVCNASGQSDTTAVLPVTMNGPTQCYCIPTTPYGSNDYINDFTTTGGVVDINNIGTGFTNNGYGDYTATDTLTAYQGNTVSFHTSLGSMWGDNFGERIWIDLNMDGVFDNATERVYQSPTNSSLTPIDGTITIPLTATPGYTRLRVRAENYNYPDPCDPIPQYNYGEAEDYTLHILELPTCTTGTFPSSVTATVDHDVLCVSGEVNLDLDTVVQLADITYQWQYAYSTSGPWTNVGTAQILPPINVTGVDTHTYYRCQILCNGSLEMTSSNVEVTINNPQLSNPTGGTRCGPGTVDLSATAGGSSTLNWYTNSTGGVPIGTGSPFTTPYIADTTDFYVAAADGTIPNTYQVIYDDNGGTIQYSGNPFYNSANSYRVQYLVTASQLQAAGFTGAGYINSIGFDVLSVGSASTFTDYTISIKNTSITGLTDGVFETGLDQVYTNASYSIVANSMNVFPFSTPGGYFWDGESNLVIQICFHNSSTNYPYPVVRGLDDYSNPLPYNCMQYTTEYTDDPNICTFDGDYPPYASKTTMPNIQFDMNTICEGPRQAVTAIVTPGPAFSISYDSVVCNNSVTELSVSSPLSNYSSYEWTPQDNLYTDASASTPYTGGNVSTVYFKSDVVGPHTYAIAATNGTSQSDCAAADTARIWVQPGGVTVIGVPDTICASDPNPVSNLLLAPASGYAPSSIQWQESGNGTAYNNITGANGDTYTTPALSVSHYYKALVTAVSGTCESPEKHVIVSDPNIIDTRDSFNCGPGTVTLQATAGGGSTPVWYADAMGGSPLAYGSSFTTPFLTVTDTFYVAGSGSVASTPGVTTIGAGAATTSYNPITPYYYDYQKNQYLITKDELNAAGVYGGALTSLAFNVASGYYDFDNFTISMGNTTVGNLTATYETGLTEVAAPQSISTSPGWNTYTFDQPFIWDGTSNVVIQVCWSNAPNGASGPAEVKMDNATFAATHYGYTYSSNPSASDICGAPDGTYFSNNGSSSTSFQRPQMQFGYFGPCESARQAVIAHIYPKPQVDLGPDINECVDSGSAIVLDAGVQPNNPVFEWDNGSTVQVRSVSQSGTYNVMVTNQYTCQGGDTIMVILRHFPKVSLGNDTTVCEGAAVTLDAGNEGIQYFWNTGATTQEITVDAAGTYNVLVTNAEGCVTADTVQVTMQGEAPTVDGIQVTNNAGFTFTFNALNPSSSVVGYTWDFGDGSPQSHQQVPTHTYADDGNYVVTLMLSSVCGTVSDSTSAHIVGINRITLDNNELKVYPNPTKERAVIETRNVRMERIEVYNVLGKRIYNAAADSPGRHELSLKGIASGIYTIQVYTDKGNVTRKLELIK